MRQHADDGSEPVMPVEETNLAESGRRQQMLKTNVRQKDFYESRYQATGADREESAANRPTRLWTRLRRRIMQLRKGQWGQRSAVASASRLVGRPATCART